MPLFASPEELKPRVLIVEDEAVTAMDLAQRLRQAGHEVAGIAGSGAEALELASSTQPNVVLMDLKLRGPMHGTEAAARLNRELELPVLILTAHTDAENLQRAAASGAYAYLVKPFNTQELTATIDMVLRRHDHSRQVRRWAVRVSEAADTERKRLAQDLHDVLAADLAALGFNLAGLATRLQQVPDLEPAVGPLAECQLRVQRLLEGIRQRLLDLRPAMLDEYGLGAALRFLGDRETKTSGLLIDVIGDDPDPRLPPALENALFRIVQEALHNVVRHARAAAATISLDRTQEGYRLSVADNGCGLAAAAVPATGAGGWGLTLMQERALAAGVRLTIESQPGRGTLVLVDIAGVKTP